MIACGHNCFRATTAALLQTLNWIVPVRAKQRCTFDRQTEAPPRTNLLVDLSAANNKSAEIPLKRIPSPLGESVSQSGASYLTFRISGKIKTLLSGESEEEEEEEEEKEEQKEEATKPRGALEPPQLNAQQAVTCLPEFPRASSVE